MRMQLPMATVQQSLVVLAYFRSVHLFFPPFFRGCNSIPPIGKWQVCGLPASLSHFVFCQYNMFSQTEGVVVPTVMSNEDEDRRNQNDVRIRFDHVKDFTVPLTEEFIDLCSEGALSIEVWGHRSVGFTGIGVECYCFLCVIIAFPHCFCLQLGKLRGKWSSSNWPKSDL